MHSRRFACFLLGMWLAGGFLLAWVTTQSVRSAERLFEEDAAVIVMLKTIGPTAGRALLRHQVLEQNREFIENWEYAQVFLSIFFFAFLLLGTREGKFSLALSALMVLLVLAQRFFLTPEMLYLGRPLDFALQGGSASDQARLSLVESVYIGVELVKWAAGLLLAVLLVFHKTRHTSLGHARQELNLVDKADHGHIDG
jgi:hypothetical protein